MGIGRARPTKDWDSLLWRFASTPIVAPGPFSHMPGIDRLQMVIGGRGLVLKAPGQEFDEREPFTTVRFTGEMEIVDRARGRPGRGREPDGAARCGGDRTSGAQGAGERPLPAGTHLVYAARGDCSVRLDGEDFAISHENTLKVELTGASTLALISGLAVLGSIRIVG